MASQALKVKANVLLKVSKPDMIYSVWVAREFIKWMNHQYLKGYCDYVTEGPSPSLTQVYFIFGHTFHLNLPKAWDLPIYLVHHPCHQCLLSTTGRYGLGPAATQNLRGKGSQSHICSGNKRMREEQVGKMILSALFGLSIQENLVLVQLQGHWPNPAWKH